MAFSACSGDNPFPANHHAAVDTNASSIGVLQIHVFNIPLARLAEIKYLTENTSKVSSGIERDELLRQCLGINRKDTLSQIK